MILDGYTENPGDLSWDLIGSQGDLTVYDRTSLTDTNEIVGRIGGAEIVFTNKTPLSSDTLARCPGLKYVGVLATGYNIVDVAAARKQGVTVTNVPTYGTNAVGQFAIALLLEICHHIGHHDKTTHNGKWTSCPDFCFWDYPLIELAEKTMGVIGFGRIGQTTGRIAKALGMELLAFDTYPNESGKALAEYVPLNTLYSEADVIALHCPLTDETAGMINKNAISRMKDGVIIINNSRGPLIVERDLYEALQSGKVYAAGIDVAATEPIKADSPLLKAKNCVITPHISWAPKECRQRIMRTAADNLKAFLSGNPVNVVNR